MPYIAIEWIHGRPITGADEDEARALIREARADIYQAIVQRRRDRWRRNAIAALMYIASAIICVGSVHLLFD